MASISHALTLPTPFVRSFAVAALMGATLLATQLSARADTVSNAAFQLAQAATPKTQAGAAATQSKGETVEQRITTLHASLKITPDEQSKWDAVAKAMRENASNMDKLVAESRTSAPRSMTAVEDLQMYQKFAQAHVDGLKNLISSFSSLYSAMPDAQKKTADSVFESAQQNRQTAAAHG
jgi:protein CpxP